LITYETDVYVYYLKIYADQSKKCTWKWPAS